MTQVFLLKPYVFKIKSVEVEVSNEARRWGLSKTKIIQTMPKKKAPNYKTEAKATEEQRQARNWSRLVNLTEMKG
jgi:hypothetical protein